MIFSPLVVLCCIAVGAFPTPSNVANVIPNANVIPKVSPMDILPNGSSNFANTTDLNSKGADTSGSVIGNSSSESNKIDGTKSNITDRIQNNMSSYSTLPSSILPSTTPIKSQTPPIDSNHSLAVMSVVGDMMHRPPSSDTNKENKEQPPILPLHSVVSASTEVIAASAKTAKKADAPVDYVDKDPNFLDKNFWNKNPTMWDRNSKMWDVHRDAQRAGSDIDDNVDHNSGIKMSDVTPPSIEDGGTGGGVVLQVAAVCLGASILILGGRKILMSMHEPSDYRSAWRNAYSTTSTSSILPTVLGRSTRDVGYQPL